ncbi:FtsX-like permease family protein [Frateuria aurantia]
MRHIIMPLLKHYLMPALVVIQVALAFAIICNVTSLIKQRIEPVIAPDGVGEPAQLVVAWHIAAKGHPWPPSRLLDVESALAYIPGVAATSIAGSVPMETLVQMDSDFYAEDGANANAAIYVGDDLTTALGLRLVAGRDFTGEERGRQYSDVGINTSGPALITRALAIRLFPGKNPLGKVITVGTGAGVGRRTVVGTVAHLMRNQTSGDSKSDLDYSVVIPGIPGAWALPVFLVRARPGFDVERLAISVRRVITRELGSELAPGLVPEVQTYHELRRQALARPRASVWLLASISAVVMFVALAGIFGLTTYWVQQRTRQIGVRRALGARRRDIFQWLQLENGLLIGSGVLIGMMLAYIINFWLMSRFEVPRLSPLYLPVGAAIMFAIGQMAVFPPANRASRISPSLATRAT